MSEQTENTAPEPTADAHPARDAILAELEQLDESGELAPEPAAEAPTEAQDGAQAAPEEQPEAEAEPEAEQEAAPAEEPEKEPEDDAKTQERLERIHREEKRVKAEVQAERDKLAEEKKQVEEQRQEVERFEAVKKRAKYDPVAAMKALGISEEDFDTVSKAIYMASPKAQKDPKLREAAAREKLRSETTSEVEELRNEIKALREEREQERAQQTQQQQMQQYAEAVTKAASATEDAPIVKTMMERNPDGAREKLLDTAARLYQQTGETPEHGDVVKALERARRTELEELGIDPQTAIKAKPKTQTPASAGETKSGGKTLTNELGTSTKPRSEPASRKDLENELLKDLEQGKIEI